MQETEDETDILSLKKHYWDHACELEYPPPPLRQERRKKPQKFSSIKNIDDIF